MTILMGTGNKVSTNVGLTFQSVYASQLASDNAGVLTFIDPDMYSKPSELASQLLTKKNTYVH